MEISNQPTNNIELLNISNAQSKPHEKEVFKAIQTPYDTRSEIHLPIVYIPQSGHGDEEERQALSM